MSDQETTDQGWRPEPLDPGALDRIRERIGGGAEPTAGELAAALEARLAADAAAAQAAEQAAQEPPMSVGDAMEQAYFAARHAQAAAREARAEAGRQAQAENGLGTAELAAFLSLPRDQQASLFRQSAEAEGLVPRDDFRWHLARAVASPAVAQVMDQAMAAGDLPETPSLLQAWGSGGRSDLIAALFGNDAEGKPYVRPAAEVEQEQAKVEAARDERGRFRSRIFGVTHNDPSGEIAKLRAELAALKAERRSAVEMVDDNAAVPQTRGSGNSILDEAARMRVLRGGH